MKSLLLTAWLMAISLFSLAQIFEPEGLNMPGAWNAWNNPPTNSVLGNSNQASGGTLAVTGFGTRKWQTQFSVAASGGNVVGGNYQFKYSSGPAPSGYWNNSWGAASFSLNTLQSTTFGAAGNNSITLTNGKWYTMNWIDIGYTTTQAIFMETSAQPITVSGIAQSPTNGSVTSNDNVTLTVTASAAPSPEELVYIRYSTNGFTSSNLATVTFVGSTGTATIPAQTAGSVVSYYLFTTTVNNPSVNDADRVAIHQHRNGAANYTYNVNSPLPPVNITFQVNMSQEFVGGAVNIAGSFNGFNPTAMTNAGGGIYTYTTSIAQNTSVSYKFLNGFTYENNIGSPCGDGTNRTYAVGTADATIGVVCWNSCSACPPSHDVTFQVNMNAATVSPNGVHLAGPFQGWNPGSTAMTDPDSDGIYSVTLQLAEGITYPYKFINGNGWGSDESVPGACNSSGNRTVTVGTGDMTIAPVCFGLCTNCPSQNYNVTFAVNMNQQTVSPNGVHLAGSFQSWEPATTPMTDPDNDGVYTVTVSVPENTSFLYKFVNGNSWGNAESVPVACNASGNRSAAVATSDITLPTVCFGLCTDCPNGNYNVTFQVDMSGQTVSPNGVHIAGSFQEWDPNGTPMSDGNADGIYTVTLSMPENTTYFYKFVNGNAWGSDESVPGACNTSGNRSFLLNTSDITLPVVCYGLCTTCPPAIDNAASAQMISAANAWYPQCATYSGNCATSTNSSESDAFSGPDQWYRFVAGTPAVSIQLTTTGMDGAIQLCNSALVPIAGATENTSNATSGTETLNLDGLTIGQTYYVSVGAASGNGGAYSVCIKQLLPSACNTSVVSPLNICSTFKPKWTGANSYTLNFAPLPGSVGGGSGTVTGSTSLSNPAFGLIPGNSYYLIINANYTSLQNANGDDIDIIVYGANPGCVVTIAPSSDIQVRASQRCSAPATLLPNAFLRTDPFICAVTSYTFEFTPVSGCADPTPTGIPFTSTYHSRIIPLTLPTGTSPANLSILPQTYYRVRVRPNYGVGGSVQGSYGTPQTIFVGGSVLEESQTMQPMTEENQKTESQIAEAVIYPNPNHGSGFILNAVDLKSPSVRVVIIDALGKTLFDKSYNVEGYINTTIQPNRDLAHGIYYVQIVDGDRYTTLKMVVE
jgi:hypothetical protein